MQEIVDFGREVITVVAVALRAVEDRQHSDEAMHAIALHGSVVELLACCIAMADEDGASAGIPIVLRSVYEVLVDLDNLILGKNYLAHMDAANLKQLCKLLNQAESNPLFAGLSERVDAPSLLAEFDAPALS